MPDYCHARHFFPRFIIEAGSRYCNLSNIIKFQADIYTDTDYGPGSLVTRERPAVAAARVLEESQQIPFIVVTNGEEAEVLTIDGKVIAGPGGLDIIPSKDEVETQMSELDLSPWPAEKREPELRILNAFDVEVCCAGGPCALPGAEEG